MRHYRASFFSSVMLVRNCQRRLVVITPIVLRDLATQSAMKECALSLGRSLSPARVGAGALLDLLLFLRRLAALRMLIS
jgi:hypothetical protein